MVTIKWSPPEQEDTFGNITSYTVTFGILGNETTLNVNITPNMNEYHLMDLGEHIHILLSCKELRKTINEINMLIFV